MMKDQKLCEHLGFNLEQWRKHLNPRAFSPDPTIIANLDRLCHRLFVIEQAFGIPVMLKVNSGLRSKTLQSQIDRAAGREPRLGSKHLMGLAAYIRDPGHALYEAISNDPALQEILDVYLEHKDYTATWCHIQIEPPASRSRIFKPY
jgi:hypothetical protein